MHLKKLEQDFSVCKVKDLSKVSGVLAASKIGIFAISTYNTDYILTKSDNYDRAIEVLEQAGYQFI